MAIGDNKGWDGILKAKEDPKVPELIEKIYNDWQKRELTGVQSGAKNESDGKSASSQGSSSSPDVTASPVIVPQFYYGFLDEHEIFEFDKYWWRIHTYDCIGETTFVQALHTNRDLYQVLENKHNSASSQERKNRKQLHDALFASKYSGEGEPHKAIHFLDRLGKSSEDRPKLEPQWNWAFIEVTRTDTGHKNPSSEDALTHFLMGKDKEKCQLWAPLLTDAELGYMEATIANPNWFKDDVVPFLEEIFSLHHIPDADIWGSDPTPLDPVPPPIVLSDGFWLDDDMDLWPKKDTLSGKKLDLNLDKLRPLPEGREPKAYIKGQGCFDILIPTHNQLWETQLYLLKKEGEGYRGFRLKIENDTVKISETYSEGYEVEFRSDNVSTTSVPLTQNGEQFIAQSVSPNKLDQQSASSTSKKSTSSVKTPPEVQGGQVLMSKNEPPQTPIKQTTKPNKVVTEKVVLQKVEYTVLRDITNIQSSNKDQGGGVHKSSRPSAASSSSFKPQKNSTQQNKENTSFIMVHVDE